MVLTLSAQNKLGGGEGIEGLYGSITQASMQKVINCLQYNTSLDSRSVFIDIGAGLGRYIGTVAPALSRFVMFCMMS